MKLNSTAWFRSLGLRRLLQLVAHLPNFLKLFWRLLKDPRVPFTSKLIVVATLAYVISPVDLIPDFLVGLGEVDDLLVIFLGLKLFIRFCPKEVVREHVRAIAAGR